LILTWASIATADGTTDAAALKQFETGRAAFDKGELPQALAAFTASMQALPSPNTRLYIARCQRGLGKIGSAYTSYRLAAREATDRLNATGEKRYTATRDTAQAEAAEIEKSVPHLTVTLPADTPPATTVQLDDVEMPRTGLASLDVDPGAHALRVVAPRRATFEQRFEIGQGEQKSIAVTMPRLPTATVQLAFKSKPAGLAVEIDGRPVDPSVASNIQEVDVGSHAVVVRAPGYRDFVWKQSLADGELKTVDVAFQPASGTAAEGSHGTPKWLFFGVAALSVVALGVGTYFAIDATSRSSSEKEKDPLTRSRAEQDEIRSQSTAANVLFIAGAAIAGGAGALAFITDWHGGATPPTPRTGQRPKVEPFFAVSGGGLKGSF
jgi:hypothetical protein